MSSEKIAQILFALARAERRLQKQADELHDQHNYSAEIPAADAEKLREAIQILSRPSDLARYQEWTESVWFNTDQSFQTNVMVAALGLAGEAGEVCELLKKHHRGDGELDKHALELELGDVVYYVTRLATLHGLELERIFESNVEKIERRIVRATTRGSGSNR